MANITKDNLTAVINKLQKILYFEAGRYNKDKELGADAIGDICNLMEDSGLGSGEWITVKTLLPVKVKQYKKLGKVIECGRCRGRRFAYVEDISCGRTVIGFEGNTLLLEGRYDTDGYDEGGRCGRLTCKDCDKEYSLDGIDIDFR